MHSIETGAESWARSPDPKQSQAPPRPTQLADVGSFGGDHATIANHALIATDVAIVFMPLE